MARQLESPGFKGRVIICLLLVIDGDEEEGCRHYWNQKLVLFGFLLRALSVGGTTEQVSRSESSIRSVGEVPLRMNYEQKPFQSRV